jgi:hypothetical protein
VRVTFDAAAHYQGRSFGSLLREMSPATDEAPPKAMTDLLDRVDRFHRWIPYAPVSGKCLLRSFLLLRLLRRAGLQATWVFGVRTWPFHAHCWLQCGDMVLDDTADRIAAYAPILAV